MLKVLAALSCLVATQAAAGSFLLSAKSADVQLVGDGDSITFGYSANESYMQYLWQDQKTANGKYASIIIHGVIGDSWNFIDTVDGASQNLTQLAPTAVDPYRSTKIPTKLILYAGPNDYFNGSTGAQTYAYFITYFQARVAAGWAASQIYVCTTLPRGDDESQRTSYNAALVSGAGTYGYNVVRLDQDATIGAAGDEDNLTYFNSDKIHPTTAGQAIMATDICNAVC